MRSTGAHIRSNIIGYVALFFALSTGAYAAGLANNSVKSKHIKDGQVKTADVRDYSLAAADLGASSVTSWHIASNSVSTGLVADNSLGAADLGPDSVQSSEIAADAVQSSELDANAAGKSEIAGNSIGSEELLAIDEVVNTQTVPVDQALTVVATCPAGQQIISGGNGKVSNGLGGNVPLQFSHRSAGGWQVRYYNGFGVPVNVSAYAYCLSA